MDQRERYNDPREDMKSVAEAQQAKIMTAMPVRVVKDSDGHTVSIQPTLKAVVRQPDGTVKQQEYPVLQDVPVQFSGGGGVTATHPIKSDDEGIAIFMSRSMDGWHQNGGTQAQIDARMHDMSDAMYIPGIRSTPRKLEKFNAEAAEMRSDDGKHKVSLHPKDGPAMSADDGKHVVSAHPDKGISVKTSTKLAVDAAGGSEFKGKTHFADAVTSAKSFDAPSIGGAALAGLADAIKGLTDQGTSQGQSISALSGSVSDLAASDAAQDDAIAGISARLDGAYDGVGQIKAATWGLWRLRQTRMKLRQLAALKAGQTNAIPANTQLCVVNIGDSYTYRMSHVEPLSWSLRALAGHAGGGFVNLRAPYNKPHSVTGEYGTTLSGAWVETIESLPTPDLGCITSSTAGDRVTVTGPAAPILSAIALYYAPTSDGQMRYRWNGGAWTPLPMTSGAGSTRVALTGFPTSGAWTLDLEVVSGTCRPNGFDVRSAGPGVRMNKVAQDGSAAFHWSAQAATSAWVAGHAALNPDLFIIQLSANDQINRTPAQIAADILTIAQRCKVAEPAADILISQQPENQFGRSTTMASITVAVRAMCVANSLPFLDQQYVFGDSVADYSATSPHNWMPDLIHPDDVYGGPAMADALYRAIVHSL